MSLPPSSAPTATGWSDSYRAGFAPAEEWRLSRRTFAERLHAATRRRGGSGVRGLDLSHRRTVVAPGHDTAEMPARCMALDGVDEASRSTGPKDSAWGAAWTTTDGTDERERGAARFVRHRRRSPTWPRSGSRFHHGVESAPVAWVGGAVGSAAVSWKSRGYWSRRCHVAVLLECGDHAGTKCSKGPVAGRRHR